MSDLEKAFNALKDKQPRINLVNQYYEGDQPLVYTANRLREAFNAPLTPFEQNWCAAVIDILLDRLSLIDFDVVNNEEADQMLDVFASDNDLGLLADDVHKDALICGESYLIVWPNQTNPKVIDAFHNRASMCHLFYRADNPKIKKFGAKWYLSDDTEKWNIVLYYADHFERYESTGKEKPESIDGFKKIETKPHKLGQVPVFRFDCPNELKKIMPVQDAINKLFGDMMIASEFSTFKQRWVITNADIKDLKNAPNEIWSIPAGDGKGQETQVGEFSGEDLSKWSSPIDALGNFIAIVTRTPKNYLTNVGAGISGDALVAMEAPLSKKASKRILSFSKTWKEIAVFVLGLQNIIIEKRDVTPVWLKVRSEQPLAEAQAINFNSSSGIPASTTLRWQGKTKAEIEQLKIDQLDEKMNSGTLSSALLEKARKDAANSDLTGEETINAE